MSDSHTLADNNFDFRPDECCVGRMGTPRHAAGARNRRKQAGAAGIQSGNHGSGGALSGGAMRLMAEKAIEGGNSNSALIVLIGAETVMIQRPPAAIRLL